MVQKREKKIMKTVSLDQVNADVQQIRREIDAIKDAFIPQVDISEKEHLELDKIEKQMEEGNFVPWRKVAKQK